MTIYRRLTVASLVLIAIGASLLAPLAVSHAEQARAVKSIAVAPMQPAPVVQAAAKGKPRYISVASVNIALPVKDGVYSTSTGEWTLDDEHAFYGVSTSLANSDSGNTFVYGHNSRAVFGSLPKLQPGDTAVITTDTGYEFTYKFVTSETVKPTDTIVLEYRGDTPRLTLQTCTGIWGEARHIFYFELVSYKKQ